VPFGPGSDQSRDRSGSGFKAGTKSSSSGLGTKARRYANVSRHDCPAFREIAATPSAAARTGSSKRPVHPPVWSTGTSTGVVLPFVMAGVY